MTSFNGGKLNYVFTNKANLPKSLDPKDSDFAENSLIQEQVVGTLLAYKDGNYLPYIASEFNVSSDGKIYTFKIRDNLKSEAGIKITPLLIKQNLEKLLKQYLEYSEVPLFNYLKGFDLFSKNLNEIEGIKIKGDSLLFEFSKKPVGILNYFVMPYYGLHLK
ncbi:hypothetical protein OAT67_06055, partial [Bacteriovoracaceae bacterium]|nr:hypothetical protein [Bacteriovoracaceae bacterium]